MPQGRLSGRFRKRSAVPDGGMRMPAMPVAQMPGAGQAGLARMAMLAVELARKADASLVLKRLDARKRGVTRRGRKPRRMPIRCGNARKRGLFGAFGAFFGGLEGPKKAPRGGFSLGINALGRPEGVAL